MARENLTEIWLIIFSKVFWKHLFSQFLNSTKATSLNDNKATHLNGKLVQLFYTKKLGLQMVTNLSI